MDHENQPAGGDLDLFGRPLAPIRDRRGRPSFKKTLENMDFVSVRAAAGWTRERIATAMGVDVKTLRKNFSHELEHGHLHVEGMMLDVLLRRVREGHTPSIRQLADRLDRALPVAPRKQSLDADDEDAPAKPLGKKEQALVDAGAVPEEYGDIFARRQRH